MHRRLFLALAAVAALPAVARASSGGGGDKKKSGGGAYLQLPTLIASMSRTGNRRGGMSVDCGLHIPDEALRLRAEQSTPRLRAAYVQTIQAYATGLAAGALPSPDYIAQALQRQTDAILGKPGARILLGAIIVN